MGLQIRPQDLGIEPSKYKTLITAEAKSILTIKTNYYEKRSKDS